MIAEVKLTHGRVALIDERDTELVAPYRWHATRTNSSEYSYAVTDVKGRRIFMHRLIANPGAGELVDHANGNRLDNRRENLRVCSYAENLQNRKPHKNSQSGLKGAFPYRDRWIARITAFGKKYELGKFDTKEEAHAAYAAAALKLHGDFARTEHYPPPFCTKRSTNERQVVEPHARPVDVLSDMERRVLDLLSSGLGTTEVASALHRSVNTVSTHLKRVQKKLGTKSTIQSAVVWALRRTAADAEYGSWESS